MYYVLRSKFVPANVHEYMKCIKKIWKMPNALERGHRLLQCNRFNYQPYCLTRL